MTLWCYLCGATMVNQAHTWTVCIDCWKVELGREPALVDWADRLGYSKPSGPGVRGPGS